MLDRILNIVRQKLNSKTTAKNRLKLMLVQDRAIVEKNILELMDKEKPLVNHESAKSNARLRLSAPMKHK